MTLPGAFEKPIFDIYHPNDEFNMKARAKLKSWKDSVQITQWNELLTRSDVVKFVVVRHPLTRFVSVWDDHYCRSCEPPKDPMLEKNLNIDNQEEYQISLNSLAQAVVDQGWYHLVYSVTLIVSNLNSTDTFYQRLRQICLRRN